MRLRPVLWALLACSSAAARQPMHTRNVMVVTQEPLAADAGLSVLRAGGNAIDAAIAIGFALAATYPYAGNLGGGGFLLAHLADGRNIFIDFRETAPAGASRNMFLDAKGELSHDSLGGWRAAGVPGTVRGLELAHQKYGRAKWADLVQPAIDFAKRGFPVSYYFQTQLDHHRKDFALWPDSERIFGGLHYGDTLRQPELAETLTRIRDGGAADFYEGETARRLASEMATHGGLITLEDLKRYRAVEREPLKGHYKGFEVVTSPLPSSGGIAILQMLGMLEGSGYEKDGAGSASELHYLAEVMRRAYADRMDLGDADFVKPPVSQLLDPKYLAERRATIEPGQASKSEDIRPGVTVVHKEGTETTHYNVADAEGNVVQVTYTLNEGFGSAVTVPGLGFLLNNEMDDFAAKPGTPNLFKLIQGEANAIAPQKRPLSSMTPTLLLRDGKPFLALGAPGGSRIITAVLQVILNVVDFHMNVQDAVDWPRCHQQWLPDLLYLEQGVSPDTVAKLRGMGYRIASAEATAEVTARVGAILFDGGWLQGAWDGRGDGKAEGY